MIDGTITSAVETDIADYATLAEYERYDEARRAVDDLSDRGFEVGRTAIVWHGLRRIERVTGRRTVARAAAQGALAGAWFGTFVGLLLALFVDSDGSGEFFGIVASYLVTGAALGAIWFGVGHWMTRGRRDFSSFDVLDADRYEVAVAPELLVDAQRVLGVASTRPMDPPPVG